MKLGELIIEIATHGDTKQLEKSLKQLKEAEKETARQIKLNRELAKAETEEEKQLIRKNHAQKGEIETNQKLLNQMKERNKSIIAGIKGFMGFVSAVSLAVAVLDRFISSSTKANQNVITMARTSGISVDTLNKYASAGRQKNINVTQEMVGQTFENLAFQLGQQMQGQDSSILQGMNTIVQHGGKAFTSFGSSVPEFMENLRDALVGVNDYWASYSLKQMGISPELLPMLRMSKEEFANVKNRFMNEKEMTEEQKRAQELQEAKDELSKLISLLTKELIPVLKSINTILANTLGKLVKYIGGEDLPEDIRPEDKEAITNSRKTSTKIAGALGGSALLPLPPQMKLALLGLSGLTLLGEKIGENILKEGKSTGFMQLSPYGIPAYNTGVTHNNTFNTTINTTQPVNKTLESEYKRDIAETQKIEQKGSK